MSQATMNNPELYNSFVVYPEGLRPRNIKNKLTLKATPSNIDQGSNSGSTEQP